MGQMSLRQREDEEWIRLVTQHLDNIKFFGPQQPELSDLESASDQMKVLRIFLNVAVERAKKAGYEPSSTDAADLLEAASNCATSIIYAFTLPTNDENMENARRLFRMTWSATPGLLYDDTKQFGRMQVDRASLEHGVGIYLRSNFKDARIDRFLIRALADMEVSNFLATQIYPSILFLDSPIEQYRRKVVVDWLKQTGRRLTIATAVCAALIALKLNYASTPDWVVIGGLAVFGGGFLLSMVFTLISLIVNGPQITAQRKRSMATIQVAADFYSEFYEAGPVSTEHYRKRLEEARKNGIVWPPSLWALLDDMECRRVRFF